MKRILCLLAVSVFTSVASSADELPFRNRQLPLERRVEDLLSRLTLEEKEVLCHGDFMTGGVPRLGIPQLALLDGRQGLRPTGKDKRINTTLLPSALALSCTWDEAAAETFGRVLAEEMLAFNKHVLLAPMINLVRSPLGGRNFENFGEDPLLAGRFAAAYVRGVQSLHVGACACLVVANDCETKRHFTNSNLDERTLREVHLLPTELSYTEGHVWTMMAANSLYNGVHCAQNRHLMQEVVKDQIGFDGVMLTDWRAAYDTVPTALAGTDMTTGICGYVFGEGRLVAAVKSGQVPLALVDEKVRRILRVYFLCGVIDPDLRPRGELDSPAHRRAARELGAQGIVLLKNERHVLPLDPAKVRRILVTGPAANLVLQGGGSGAVPAAIEVTPLQGLKAAYGDQAVTYLPYNVPIRPRVSRGAIEWEPVVPKNAPAGDDSRRVTEIPALARAAADADAVVFVATSVLPSEGRDLADMDLPGRQAEAIAALAAANRKVVVVLVANGAVTTAPWLSQVSAVLSAPYIGEATGDALADVLTGRVNPAGKLSYSFAARLADYPAHALGEWPAKLVLAQDPGNPPMKPELRHPVRAYDTEYHEGVFVGYRWMDEHAIEPVFPFGHGLSYTTFELQDLKVSGDGRRVSCVLKNTGDRTGAEVVQVYIAPPKSAVARPARELKGFAKVTLQPGESQRVEVALRPSAYAYFDVAAQKWKTDAGRYEVQVGCSSRDIRLRAPVTISSAGVLDRY